jgi:hypothetical protein
MDKEKFRKIFLNKWMALVFGLLMVITVMWRMADADAPTMSHPAQKQVKDILYSLQDSEAERASGAYFPSQGVFISLDLIRGPNSVKGRQSFEGVRDWGIYLMQTFGGKLTAVPTSENIAMSIDFYDFPMFVYRQIVLISKASDIKDPSKYTIYLDGKPYGQAAGQSTQAAQATTTAAAKSTTPLATTAAATNSNTAKATTQASATTAAATAKAGPVKVQVDFTDPQAAAQQWKVINGQWAFNGGSYVQNELGKYDLVSMFTTPLAGDIKIQADLKYIQGDMGGGLVFNAPKVDTKNGAYMVSYTGKGTYLQWGYYDNAGLFQYQGGASVQNSQDGKAHTLAIKTTGNLYEVSLNGVVLGSKIPINGTLGGYAGLLVSTSQINFDNVKVESTQ